MIDLERARADTPGVEHVTHLNNAGASLMPAPVVDAVIGYLREEAARGGYETAEAHGDDLEAVYGAIAGLINCRPGEVAIVDSATRAWDLCLYGMRFRPGDRILTTNSEYASNFIAYLHIARRTGAQIDVVPDSSRGGIDLDALADAIDDRVKLVSINHVPTHCGLVNPAAGVGRIARAAGIPYLLDACQSVGQLPVDVEDIGCDMLAATSRKFLRGPRGVGFLFVSSEMLDRLDPPMLDLHGADWTEPRRYQLRPDARRFEQFESFVAGKLGVARAIEYARGVGLDAIWSRVRWLADTLRQRLGAIPGVEIRDTGEVQGAIVSFTVAGFAPEDIKQRLAQRSINVAVSTLLSARLDMEARGLDAVVRASVHYFNTEDELGALVREVGEIASR